MEGAEAIGRGALTERWLGITAVEVAEPFRRQGRGRLVIGALATDGMSSLGSWRAQGKAEDVVTVLKGITMEQLAAAQERAIGTAKEMSEQLKALQALLARLR